MGASAIILDVIRGCEMVIMKRASFINRVYTITRQANHISRTRIVRDIYKCRSVI